MQRASCASISLRAARPACELRVGDAPRPRLRVARQLGHEPDPADDAALKRATPSVPGSDGKVRRQSRASTRNERLALSARAKTSSHYHSDNANSGPAGARGVIPRATKTTTSSCIPRQKRGLPAPAFVDDAAKTTGKHRATVSRDAVGLFPCTQGQQDDRYNMCHRGPWLRTTPSTPKRSR